MKRGVLLLALGDPGYGRMAFNLAVNLRLASPNLSIALGYCEESIRDLTDFHRSFFSEIFEIPKEMYVYFHKKSSLNDFFAGKYTEGKLTGRVNLDNRKDYFKAKTHIYDLSPFDQTIFLDADTIWDIRKPIDEIFDRLSSVGFAMNNREFYDLRNYDAIKDTAGHWARVRSYVEIFGMKPKWVEMSSFFIYFQKNAQNKAFFDKVKAHSENTHPSHPANASLYKNNSRPDEAFFSSAAYELQYYPMGMPFAPVYMYLHEGWDTHSYYGLTFSGYPGESGAILYQNRMREIYTQAKLPINEKFLILHK